MNEEYNYRFFGCMLDCSRNAVMTVDSIKKWIDISSDIGYNMLMLYTEDTYEIKSQPYFGYGRGRYSVAELKELNCYAKSKGIELIPCIQTLAHLNQIVRWPAYAEHIDQKDILLVGDDEVYNLIEDMFDTVCDCYSSEYIHVGMDEAHGLGRGKYYDIHGDNNGSQILIDHLKRVSEIGKKHGKKLCIWADMFYRLIAGGKYNDLPAEIDKSICDQIPDNVELVYWDYYSTTVDRYDKRIKSHNRIKDGTWFAGAFRSWWGFAPHNAYSIKATAAAVTACRNNNVKDMMFTIWGDDGAECSKFSLLPSLFYTSELIKGNNDDTDIKLKFEKKFGISFDDFMLLDLPFSPNGERVSNGICDRTRYNGDDSGLFNSEKYLLYNDIFTGLLDSTLMGNEREGFKKCAEKLHRLENNTEWGYLFRSEAALCEVLSIKCDLGQKTRKAYASGNKVEISDLLKDYDELLYKLDAFYNAYREQWYAENKGQGFEVQDIRLGGLKQRTAHCKKMLEDYISGKTDKIDELEEKLLDYKGAGEELQGKPVMENHWGRIVSANLIGQKF